MRTGLANARRVRARRSTRPLTTWPLAAVLGGLGLVTALHGAVTFETTTAYHHLQVVDHLGLRVLSFDGDLQSRMSLANPAQGHFEYTEYFHMPWLWNSQMNNVLMIGLGGASTQRAYQLYAPEVVVDTVEIDPVVVQVAKDYFQLKESPTLKVHQEDGRTFLRRSQKRYDVILMDAYQRNRYGSFIPHHLVTREFFALANEHLTFDGVLAYNVICTWQGRQAEVLGAVYQTLKAVFPQVYSFPARESQNIVLIATKSKEPTTATALSQRAVDLVRRGWVALPTFLTRVQAFRADVPPSAARSLVLTDDFAPVDGLLKGGSLGRGSPTGPPGAGAGDPRLPRPRAP